MQRLEVSVAVRPPYGSLGVKWLRVMASMGIVRNTNFTFSGTCVFINLRVNANRLNFLI